MNVLLEHAKFNRGVQEKHEPAEGFIAALNTLADSCSHGALRKELMRNRAVEG